MATGCDTKATQTEEDEEDYSHLTAKDINFKCREGINAKLQALKVVNEKAFIVRIELDGKLYSGWFLEAIDNFQPVNFKSFKRHRTTGYKKVIKRYSVVKRARKPKVYSKENYPKAYVDPQNTIESRLRYGRVRRTPVSSTSPSVGNSPSHSKDRSDLSKDNRKMKLQHSEGAENSASLEDSPFRERKYKKCKHLKDLKCAKYDGSTEATTSNGNFTPSCMLSTTDNEITPISVKQDKEKTEASIDTSLYSPETKMQYSPRKNEELQATINLICIANAALGQSAHHLGPKHDLMTFSPEINIDSRCKNTVDAVESEESSQVSEYQLPELDLMTFSPRINTETHCKIDNAVQEAASSQVFRHQLPALDLMTFSPEINTKTHCMNYDDAVQSAAVSQVSRYQVPVPDLMTFSPRVNTETHFKNDRAVQNATSNQMSLYELPKSDLLTSSPRINTEMHCKNNDNAVKIASSSPVLYKLLSGSNPPVNLRINDTMQYIDCSDVKRVSSSTTVSLHKFPKKQDHTLRKSSDTKCIDGDGKLHVSESSFDQFPESNLRSIPLRKDMSVSNYTSMKITSNEVFCRSPESKLQRNQRNIDEIQSRHDLNRFETPKLSSIRFRQSKAKSCPGIYEEIQDIRPNIDLKTTARKSRSQQFKSHGKVDTQGIIEKSNEQRSSGDISNLSFESIQRNGPNKERIRSHSDRTVEYSERKVTLPKKLPELNLPMNNEIRLINDGTDLQKIESCESPFQKPTEDATSYRSGKNVTELNIGEKLNAQSPLSSEYSAHQRPRCRLKYFSKDDVTQLGDDSNVIPEVAVEELSYQSSENKPQPSFKESECTMPVMEDNNASFTQSPSLLDTPGEMPGKTEEMRFVSEVTPTQDSITPELLCDSRKIEDNACVNSSIENETLGDLLHHIMMLCDIEENGGTGGTENDNVESKE